MPFLSLDLPMTAIYNVRAGDAVIDRVRHGCTKSNNTVYSFYPPIAGAI